jgi:hypothetical protein
MDARLGIQGAFSKGLQRVLTHLAVLMPYGKASQVAEELAGIKVTDSSIWEIVQKASSKEHSAWNPITSQKQSHSERMGVAMDGCVINVRHEGWKEAKIGVIFEVEDVANTNSEGDVHDVACIQTSCVLHLGGPEGLSNQLAAEARARHFSQAAQQSVVADGAEWIWRIAECDYPNAVQVNDWYHACQHLHTAAALIFPDADQTEPLASWIEHHKQVLYGGGANLVSHEIRTRAGAHGGKNKALMETEAGYFASRHARMQYADFHDAGLPIGSGVVEGTAKQVKHRMSASGMRWSRSGADRLAPFLAAEISGTFAAYWKKTCP